jgi:hypothetical protein
MIRSSMGFMSAMLYAIAGQDDMSVLSRICEQGLNQALRFLSAKL